MVAPYISMAGIGKSFGPVHALKSVDLTIYPHEIHALLGENGAGKSTLMKVLSGIHAPTKGTITINEIDYDRLDHKMAAKLGIGIIYQELSVIDELTVLENLYIGRHLTKKVCGVNIVDWKEMRVRAAMMLLRIGLKVDLEEKVANLSISHKQMLEIAKTLMLDAKVIIMDEPTSSLTNKEVDYLFLIMNQLRKEGTAIVYISHKLAEIRRICDRYTVMKDGSSVCSGRVSEVSNDDIVHLMVGRELQNRFNRMKESTGNVERDTVFEVKNVTSRDRKKVRDISFNVSRGEILGFAGLVGSGRTELMDCLFGVDKRSSGEIRLNGRDISPRSPLDAVKKGMAYITESRRDNGFFPNFSIAQNMAISHSLKSGGFKGAMGLFREAEERTVAEAQRQLLALKCHSVAQNITELSGGNQQKVLISKWLCCNPEVIIFDEPTRGIDVGAKAEIYKVMRGLADEGKVILMVSSELPEIIAVCDRIAVFCEGRLTQILTNRDNLSEEEIMAWALPQE
ncbi:MULTISPECIES: D-allose ABC transporter ATP-binding protein AlsA [unclassified Erwinia]|uniref:D-allose ABC transporter ATP-binding protein AlsA n=1 Tax=unclassified Erwinia TaxID=2622719 RepID=UPI00190E40D8|nr:MULTISPECIES: D-allose ABC transporter ATP-binding protein AlsA [unclassified Erwinia]MBK0001473.1 D-allose ABC transporter ATP-binding protein AlsA [Erwinia sp. S38]MCW1876846.1 D-allose ABC transporter ATP-binding protein AlsA [Erwinia sp. INIA01]